MNMKLEIIEKELSVCKIKSIEKVDFSRQFVFLSKTPDEISLVCDTDAVPKDAIETEHDWKALRVVGQLDFGLLGIIAKISKTLADAKISVFVISTFNTDYILVKTKNIAAAITALLDNGYEIAGENGSRTQ